MKTPLDEILQEARQNSERGQEYVNVFLNSELFIPVWNDIDKQMNEESQVTIQPITATNEQGTYVMVFDTKEKLENWIDVSVAAAQMTGYELVNLVKEQNLQICMNAGTEFIKVFDQNEINWILDNIQGD